MNHIIIALLALALGSVAEAGDHDSYEREIHLASELSDWCKDESAAYFIGQGFNPSNWTSSYSDRSNMLYAEGKWLINRDVEGRLLAHRERVTVKCQIARGARARYGVLEILE